MRVKTRRRISTTKDRGAFSMETSLNKILNSFLSSRASQKYEKSMTWRNSKSDSTNRNVLLTCTIYSMMSHGRVAYWGKFYDTAFRKNLLPLKTNFSYRLTHIHPRGIFHHKYFMLTIHTVFKSRSCQFFSRLVQQQKEM